MSFTKSPQIVSSQTALHGNLKKVVDRYLNSEYQNSIPKYARDAFKIADDFVRKRNASVILDSGCGTGESTYHLARQYPDHTVIGIDKSASRLERYAHEMCPNQLFLHADCISFWQLATQSPWRLEQHYLLYPNPWPKPGHLQRRWHAHPVFPLMIKLGGTLVMRTNWDIYAREFAYVISIILNRPVECVTLQVSNSISAHEKKYLHSQHQLYEVRAEL